jgi:hypothetical protein
MHRSCSSMLERSNDGYGQWDVSREKWGGDAQGYFALTKNYENKFREKLFAMSQKNNVAQEESIGRMMGENPSYSWQVMNAEETGYCISFDCPSEAQEWFAKEKARSPDYIEQNGYHIVRYEQWPDYLGKWGDCAAVCRFINYVIGSGVLKDPTKLELFHKNIEETKKTQLALARLIGIEQENSEAN